jgi:hypothetical protein
MHEHHEIRLASNIIAHPTGDTVFRKLMENERTAKFFPRTLLEKQTISVDVCPQEFTYGGGGNLKPSPRNTGCPAASIRTEKGKREKIPEAEKNDPFHYQTSRKQYRFIEGDNWKDAPFGKIFRTFGILRRVLAGAFRTSGDLLCSSAFNIRVCLWAVMLLFTSTADVFPQSLMSSGQWYRMFIERDGIYRITYEELRDVGLDNPSQVRIYGSGGAMLPEVAGRIPDRQQEIPVMMVCKTAGVFTAGDYILFYGQGPVVWRYNATTRRFEHSLHLWDSRSVYFITSGAGGKRITAEPPPLLPANRQSSAFDEHLLHEEEIYNILFSGRHWYGEYFSDTPQTFSFADADPLAGEPAFADGAFIVRSKRPVQLEIRCNGVRTDVQTLPVSSEAVAAQSLFVAEFSPSSGAVSVELTLNRSNDAGADGWLDYLRLNCRKKLGMNASQLFFRDVRSVGEGNVTQFAIANASPDVCVWDVGNMWDVKQMSVALSGNELSFSATTDSLREFVAFRLSDGLLKPDIQKERLPNCNLRGMEADMLIVAHPDFMEAANELAELHRRKDALSVETATTLQVYDEFSSGMQDPAAIRNFAKTVWEKSRRLKYLLLMGDGSFDNKSNLIRYGKAVSNSNFVVAYQSEESLHNTQSYVSDDYFGILDDDAKILGGQLNIGVGRLPVQTGEQAQEMVNKIEKYMEMLPGGDRNSLIALLADDEDMNIHCIQSDSIAEYLRLHQPQYTVEKLYFDAFRQVPTADGHRYPEVAERLNSLLNNGCFLVNYIGHGNATGLSEERVVNTAVIDKWKHKTLPLFVAATCEFGRYDDCQRITAGEKTLLNPGGGGIALLTSTRLVYSSQNYLLTKNFFRALFSESMDGKPYRMGDFVRLSKNASGTGVNKLCFTLLGDPALRLPIPLDKVRTLSADTLKANAPVRIRAEIVDRTGQRLHDFNGTAAVSVFDQPRSASTLNNDRNATPVNFLVQTSVLYRGTATVRNGLLEASFLAPRDMNYAPGYGKISYFAWSGERTAAGGDSIAAGGASASVDDNAGPDIRLFMNDTLFRDGGITDRQPLLLAHLSDESGVNTAESVGHGITATLVTGDASVSYPLNAYYEAATDDYRKGRVAYRFPELATGEYVLLFTAWDAANNHSQADLRFRVVPNGVLQISNLYNYPNPFNDRTYIYFEYNYPDETVEMEMQIFDVSGKLLRIVRQRLFTEGYTSGQLQWDGADIHGNHMRSGLYPYRILLRTQTGQEAVKTGKMMILR